MLSPSVFFFLLLFLSYNSHHNPFFQEFAVEVLETELEVGQGGAIRAEEPVTAGDK